MRKSSTEINEKLSKVWEREPEQPIKQEAIKITLPPDHIVNYIKKEKPKEEKPVKKINKEEMISYIEAKNILGVQRATTMSNLIWKKKLVGGDGLVTLKSVMEYKENRLPKGNAGLMRARELRHNSPDEISYTEAMKILGVTRNNLYNMLSRKWIEGADGYCNLKSVLDYRKPKIGRPRKDGKMKEVKCLPPSQIKIPTLADVEAAINEVENIVGDSYKHLKIDTVAWSKANHTTEQQKAICQFMINKYTMRKKGQDQDDIKKARFYLDWLGELV